MPGRDGTGPMGTGPRGLGLGRGFGRGLGVCRNIPVNSESRLAYLEAAQKEINTQIELIKSVK